MNYGQAILNAAMWPVRDVPAIFSVASTGIGPAIPALAEIGVVAALLYLGPIQRRKAINDVEDLALAYVAATATSFLTKTVLKL